MLSVCRPLVFSLERIVRERRIAVPAEAKAARELDRSRYARLLLQRTMALHGSGLIDELAREVAGLRSHPLVRGLLSSHDSKEFLSRWQRLAAQWACSHDLTLRVDGPEARVGPTLRESDASPEALEAALWQAIGDHLLVAIGTRDSPRQPFVITNGPSTKPLAAGVAASQPASGAGSAEPWGIGDEHARAAFQVLLKDTRLSLASVARRLALSARTLQRRLSDSGTSFNEIVRVARVTRAGAALVASHDSLTLLALETGFSDGAHLSREFRDLIGMCPQDFRRVFER